VETKQNKAIHTWCLQSWSARNVLF